MFDDNDESKMYEIDRKRVTSMVLSSHLLCRMYEMANRQSSIQSLSNIQIR